MGWAFFIWIVFGSKVFHISDFLVLEYLHAHNEVYSGWDSNLKTKVFSVSYTLHKLEGNVILYLICLCFHHKLTCEFRYGIFYFRLFSEGFRFGDI